MTENQKLREALQVAEAALSDIGDADREPGDDLAWCERRAAQSLPLIRQALALPTAEQVDDINAAESFTSVTKTAAPVCEREAFEREMSKPPFEFCMDRWPDDGSYAWPGNYAAYHTQCAWDAWQARAAQSAGDAAADIGCLIAPPVVRAVTQAQELPQGYPKDAIPADYTGEVFLESQMRAALAAKPVPDVPEAAFGKMPDEIKGQWSWVHYPMLRLRKVTDPEGNEYALMDSDAVHSNTLRLFDAMFEALNSAALDTKLAAMRKEKP